jgi:hypothetical protein
LPFPPSRATKYPTILLIRCGAKALPRRGFAEYLLTDPRESDILLCGHGSLGSDAIRSTPSTRVHHAKLRDDIGKVLGQKAVQLEAQLSKLGGEVGRGRRSSLKGQKVPVKYRDKQGNTWAGRGAQPVWLREKLKAGAKLEDFAVQKTAASRKSPMRKARKRRKK